MKKTYGIIIALSIVAIINAVYLSAQAYFFRLLGNSGVTLFCDLSENVSCSSVLQSAYSQVFGIPFPWIALAVYPVILLLAIFGYLRNSLKFAKIIMGLSLMGMMFNFFIIYREIVFIKAFCILCFICTLIIITIFTLSTRLVRKNAVG